MDKKTLSTSQAAKILGISRIAVFKKIKSGEIKAKKDGRNFVIEKNEVLSSLGTTLRPQKKHQIEQSVKKTVREYGEALRLLGRE